MSLTSDEQHDISTLLDELSVRFETQSDPVLQGERSKYANELPNRVLDFLQIFRNIEPAGACLLRGLPIKTELLPPTPDHWCYDTDTNRENILLYLLGTVLGDVFGWATLQGGRLVTSVLPIRGHESDQSSQGSTATLAWHTEDAFHPYRPDYLGLMGMRNPDRVCTLYSCIDEVQVADEWVEILTQERFFIPPDEEHLRSPTSDRRMGDLPSMIELWDSPPPRPVLFGASSEPYLCTDFYYIRTRPGDDRAEAALQELHGELERNARPIMIETGTVCFIDNFKAVHGRSPFTPRYDGTDRWLKKVNISRDLRKSRALRRTASDCVLG